MQKSKDDRTKYPSIKEVREKYLFEYRQHKGVLRKFKDAFASHIYVITKAPKFYVDDEGTKQCKREYIPFKTKNDIDKKLEDSPKVKADLEKRDKTLKTFMNQHLKQKLQLTSEEAYSFAVLRQMLINEPIELDRR
jgi:glutaredoxin 2